MRRDRLRDRVAGWVRRALSPDDVVATAMEIGLRSRAAGSAYLREAGRLRERDPALVAPYARIVKLAADIDPMVADNLANVVPELLVALGGGQRLEAMGPSPAANRPAAVSLRAPPPPPSARAGLHPEVAAFERLVGRILHRRPSAAPAIAPRLVALLEDLPPHAVERFVDRAVAMHAASPARADAFLRRESSSGREAARGLVDGLALDQVHGILLHYARAHCGQDVEIAPLSEGSRAFAVPGRLFLPTRVGTWGDARDFLVYRVTTAQVAGALEFGTYALGGPEVLEARFAATADRGFARALFTAGEELRVERRVRAAYPGISRDIDALRAEAEDEPPVPEPTPAREAVAAISRWSWGQDPAAGATVAPVVAEIVALLDAAAGPDATVADVLAAMETAMLRLAVLIPPPPLPSQERPRARTPGRSDDPLAPAPFLPLEPPPGRGGLPPEQREEIEDGPAAPPASGARPEGALAPRGEASQTYREMESFLDRKNAPSGAMVERSPDREAREGRPAGGELVDGVLYPEWDHAIAEYRPQWVRVIDERFAPDGAPEAEAIHARRRVLVRRLRRSFEALRPEVLAVRRGLVDGDEIDLPAAIEARIAIRSRVSPTERIYAARRRDRRDVAAGFLVDLSSSTNEVVNTDGLRILDVEKEALICLSEALDAIGDRFAVWGFSGYGREHVAFYEAKSFRDPLDDTTRARLGAMRWKMENRDGAAIRHATRKLLAEPARTRVLFLLSDGRPLDCGCDAYFDRYAQQDTRMALLEARRAGVHPFCLTVDPRGSDYLAGMYGASGYLVVEDVESLPEKLPLLYRRLTR